MSRVVILCIGKVYTNAGTVNSYNVKW